MVQNLVDLIRTNNWQSKFEEALKKCDAENVEGFEDIKTLDDYFKWCDAQLSWIPVENNYGTLVYDHIAKFYFLLDQSPVK